MAISKAKKEKIARDKRVKEMDERSLNGKGYWMDANHEVYARLYIDEGDKAYLDALPDYRR
jgi:hypothetical protein